MKAYIVAGALALGVGVVAACEEQLPTVVDEDLLPGAARTVEVRIPWSEFGSELLVTGGFGAASSLPSAPVAHDFSGLRSRALVRFAPFPTVASVRDSTGTTRPDSSLTYVGGRIVARFDTLDVVADGAVPVAAAALDVPWDSRTATWTLAVDSVGAAVPWNEPGAGGAMSLTTAEWDPEESDSLVLVVDSAAVAAWGDTTDLARGLRLSTDEPGTFLDLRSVVLRLDTRASSNPDTIQTLSVGPQAVTFIYDPVPTPPVEGIRLGGVPSWRTFLEVSLPEMLNGPPELCEVAGCPLELTPELINFAALVLTPRAPPAAFQPRDTVLMDVRAVLAPELLPKSPLGTPLGDPFGTALRPELFDEGASGTVTLAVTSFVQDRIRGETEDGEPAPRALALLATLEPSSLAYASFQGPGEEGAPVLRLILTLGDEVRLP